MDTWKIQEAKENFSEMVERALLEGPQIVTRHGVDLVVVVSCEYFKNKKDLDFKSFLQESRGVSDISLNREKNLARENQFEISS